MTGSFRAIFWFDFICTPRSNKRIQASLFNKEENVQKRRKCIFLIWDGVTHINTMSSFKQLFCLFLFLLTVAFPFLSPQAMENEAKSDLLTLSQLSLCSGKEFGTSFVPEQWRSSLYVWLKSCFSWEAQGFLSLTNNSHPWEIKYSLICFIWFKHLFFQISLMTAVLSAIQKSNEIGSKET